jgi:hypothetical protein
MLSLQTRADGVYLTEARHRRSPAMSIPRQARLAQSSTTHDTSDQSLPLAGQAAGANLPKHQATGCHLPRACCALPSLLAPGLGCAGVRQWPPCICEWANISGRSTVLMLVPIGIGSD